MPRFVLEIGTEEIPPRFFPPALAQLHRDGRQMLERARLVFEDIKVYGTPRRLALIVEGLADRQAPETREERGPSAKIAFDADGNPAKAAQGFARRYGLSPEQLVRKETDQGEYVFAVVKAPELPAGEALAGLLPDLIAGLSFPKTMRWGTGKLRFGRPIRWLLALVDDQVVEFELEGLRSGRETRGHPVLADGMHELKQASEYEARLWELSVIVDPDERQRRIEEQLTQIAADQGGTCLHGGRWYDWPVSQFVTRPDAFATDMSTNLILQTVFLVEWPLCAMGRYDESFQNLPNPILIEEMQHVQSYFPLAEPWQDGDDDWKLLPQFIAVRDGRDHNLDGVVAGWENVLRAKLIDASFFYEQDLKRPLADRVDDLKGVVFQEKLGTMYDKVERIKAVSSALSEALELDAPRREWLARAAYLCKADLTTEVVTELSDLQGVMGAIYAADKEHQQQAEPEEVSLAIRDHYRPRSAQDDTPGTTIGTFLAIADKIDTISACFAAGIVPTGSADPFALRREGTGVVKCFEEGKFPPEISWNLSRLQASALIDVSLGGLYRQVSLSMPQQEAAKQVSGFLTQRLEAYLREQDLRYDIVQAAVSVDSDRIRAAARRARALNSAATRDSAAFARTVVAATRPINISSGYSGGQVDDSLLELGAERDLWNAYGKVKAAIDALEGGTEAYDELRFYGEVFTQLGFLVAPIDTYFDDVLVMAEDEKLRRNRLAMCWQLSQLFRRIADFSLIVQA